MDLTLQAALAHVKELEETILDQQVVIDLLHEDVSDRDSRIRALEGALRNKMIDPTYPIAVGR